MSDPLRPPAAIKPPEAPKSFKLEGRYHEYTASCGHRTHGTVSVRFGARSEQREREFNTGWDKLRAQPCPTCKEANG